MKKYFVLFAVLFALQANTQPDYLPPDLSYNFKVTKDDFGLKGNVKKLRQDVINPRATGTLSVIHGHYVTPLEDMYEEQFKREKGFNFSTAKPPHPAGYPIANRIINASLECIFNSDGNITFVYICPALWEYEYTYDNEGKIESVYDRRGKLRVSFTYEGGLLKEKQVEAEKKGYRYDEFKYPTVYSYDENGRVKDVEINVTYKGKVKETLHRSYNYSNNDGLIEINSDNEKWVFDSKKRIVKHVKYNTVTHNISEELSYLFNEKDQLIKVVDSRNSNTQYDYNENGDVSMIRHFKYNGIEDYRTTFEYEYDSVGNWVKKREYNKNENTLITTRAIEYY